MITDMTLEGKRADERICNGCGDYFLDYTYRTPGGVTKVCEPCSSSGFYIMLLPNKNLIKYGISRYGKRSCKGGYLTRSGMRSRLTAIRNGTSRSHRSDGTVRYSDICDQDAVFIYRLPITDIHFMERQEVIFRAHTFDSIYRRDESKKRIKNGGGDSDYRYLTDEVLTALVQLITIYPEGRTRVGINFLSKRGAISDVTALVEYDESLATAQAIHRIKGYLA